MKQTGEAQRRLLCKASQCEEPDLWCLWTCWVLEWFKARVLKGCVVFSAAFETEKVYHSGGKEKRPLTSVSNQKECAEYLQMFGINPRWDAEGR